MGNGQKNKEVKLQIIWIAPNVDNDENKDYCEKIRSLDSVQLKTFKEIKGAIKYLKTIKFTETKILISSKLYYDFVKCFQENLTEMNIAPKIQIFTRNKERIKNNEDYQNTDLFYRFGGIAIEFKEVKDFLNKGIERRRDYRLETINNKKPDNIPMTFEYIDRIEKLVLPILFKSIIDDIPIVNMDNYTIKLYNTFEASADIKLLLGSIYSVPNIPIEILSKYYARAYTLESDLYKIMNEDLLHNQIKDYEQSIKTLYEGVKLKALPLATNKKLYRGGKIPTYEAQKIKKELEHGNNDIPKIIAFSKSFLSFSKDRKEAENFMNKALSGKNSKEYYSKVLYIVEKDDSIGYDLSTHGDIENISKYSYEKEVLFFPFSAFEIHDLEEIYSERDNETRYEIRLLYLGKYLKKIKENKTLIDEGTKLPESEFKKQLIDFGIIQKEKLETINTKVLYNSYKEFKKKIKKNYIKGKIIIGLDDINKDIRIINSFENVKSTENINDKKDDINYNNEEEIKENVVIKIDKKIIDFSYYHKFEKEGEYDIKYIIKRNLSNINHMFYHCSNLVKLDFSNFDSHYISNTCKLFYDCSSLEELILRNFNTHNVDKMAHMFEGCKSLINLDLSSFDTSNVTDMNHMFYFCNSLTNLNLGNFDIHNVNDNSYMFSECNSLDKKNIITTDKDNEILKLFDN